MNTIVIENVLVNELPAAWRTKLSSPLDATVTVRIEQDSGNQAPAVSAQPQPEVADDPLFGMWADREDMADVPAYIRKIRTGRFNADDIKSNEASADLTRTDTNGTDVSKQD